MKNFYLFLITTFFVLSLAQVNAQKNVSLSPIHGVANTISNLNSKIAPATEDIPSLHQAEQSTEVKSDNEVMAPPANDDCTGGLAAAYTLTPNTPCVSGTETGATLNGSDSYGCLAPLPTYTVWYSFVADQANLIVSVRGVTNFCSYSFGLVVWKYSGVCPPASAPVGCSNYYTPVGQQYIYNNLSLAGLTIGATYVVMVAQQGAPTCANNTRDFCIALHHPTTCTTCASPCGPLAVSNSAGDPGVPWAIANAPIYAYHPPLNEFDTSTMCWTFTADNTTMYMSSAIDVWCPGPNTFTWTYSLYSSACGLISTGNVFSSNQLTGLVVGHNYIICYTIQAYCVRDTIWPYLYGASVLQEELLSFDAKVNKDDIDILWTTASEVNTSEFVVERTKNGKDFTEIKRIKAAGNSTSVLNYKITDYNPLEGSNYYRLKEIDFDGTVTLGRLIVVRFIKNNNDLRVIPNPAQNEVGVNYFSAKDAMTTISIIDVKGVIVLTKNVIADYEGANNILFDISKFEPGIYTVLFVCADKNLNTRFVKQ